MIRPSGSPLLRRRHFLRRAGTLCLLPIAPLLALPSTTHAAKLSATELLTELDELSQRLRAGQIDGDSWQAQSEALFARADAHDMLAAITLDWKPIQLETRRLGQIVHPLAPAELRGCPPDPAFRRKLFAFSSNHAVIPHAHHNLVSAFWVLAGSFRGRHFDRIREDTDAVIIRPADDRSFQVGDAAAISDLRNNVHWFTALEHESLLFNVSVTIPEHLRGSSASATGRIYLDPEGEPLDGGLIRAPRASVSQLQAKYDG
jgi:hypothetical protein